MRNGLHEKLIKNEEKNIYKVILHMYSGI